MAEHKRYRAWYIPQVPGTPFEVETESLRDAVLIKETLERFSAFEYENRIKPDYSDASGVSEWDDEGGEWYDVDDFELEQTLGMAGEL